MYDATCRDALWRKSSQFRRANLSVVLLNISISKFVLFHIYCVNYLCWTSEAKIQRSAPKYFDHTDGLHQEKAQRLTEEITQILKLTAFCKDLLEILPYFQKINILLKSKFICMNFNRLILEMQLKTIFKKRLNLDAVQENNHH
jgi:DNA-directed RNA polymerase subunit F